MTKGTIISMVMAMIVLAGCEGSPKETLPDGRLRSDFIPVPVRAGLLITRIPEQGLVCVSQYEGGVWCQPNTGK